MIADTNARPDPNRRAVGGLEELFLLDSDVAHRSVELTRGTIGFPMTNKS